MPSAVCIFAAVLRLVASGVLGILSIYRGLYHKTLNPINPIGLYGALGQGFLRSGCQVLWGIGVSYP